MVNIDTYFVTNNLNVNMLIILISLNTIDFLFNQFYRRSPVSFHICNVWLTEMVLPIIDEDIVIVLLVLNL